MKRTIPLDDLQFATRCVHGGVYKDAQDVKSYLDPSFVMDLAKSAK